MPERAWNSVGTGPGQSAVTLMPRPANSWCSASLKDSTKALEALPEQVDGADEENSRVRVLKYPAEPIGRHEHRIPSKLLLPPRKRGAFAGMSGRGFTTAAP